MQKLKLDLDQLAVDTFGTVETAPGRGTALAHEFGPQPQEPVIGTGSGWTGMDTCEGESCLQTCTFDTCLSCTATQMS